VENENNNALKTKGYNLELCFWTLAKRCIVCACHARHFFVPTISHFIARLVDEVEVITSCYDLVAYPQNLFFFDLRALTRYLVFFF
jgi:hypothetical protein